MISKQYATGLALMVMAVCSPGPRWMNLVFGALGVWMWMTDGEDKP